jgi:hypothetical protein
MKKWLDFEFLAPSPAANNGKRDVRSEKRVSDGPKGHQFENHKKKTKKSTQSGLVVSGSFEYYGRTYSEHGIPHPLALDKARAVKIVDQLGIGGPRTEPRH